MKLHEIIALNGNANELLNGSYICTEKFMPYKKSLLTYYRDLYGCEPVVMVSSVFNVGAWGRIVPADLLTECVAAYLTDDVCESVSDPDDEKFGEYETIMFNSIFLKDL